MHSFASLAIALLASTVLAADRRLRPAPERRTEDLRLIKTSSSDPGQWMTPEQRNGLSAHHVHFYDITNATAEAVARLSKQEDSMITARAVTYPTTVTHQSTANPLIQQASTDKPKVWMREMTDFYNRYYTTATGTEAAQWMFDTAKGLVQSDASIQVSQFPHTSFNQPSVIVKIPGSRSTELIILGAHFDSTGGGPDARGPGADDNASGVVVLLEALRILASTGYRPENTLEFHFYAGEEGGMLGSHDIFKAYSEAKTKVLAMLNQDMAGYSPSGRIAMFAGKDDASLRTYAALVAKAYTGLDTTLDSTACRSACSDHASAYAYGYPAAYAADEVDKTSTPYYHSPNDSYETIGWDTVLRHIVFTIGFTVEASFLKSS